MSDRGTHSISAGAAILLLILFWLSAGKPAFVQAVGGTLAGTVRDTSKGLIPNSQVSIRNTETQIVRIVRTNNEGFYVAPNLLPGLYEISATAPGFRTSNAAGVTLSVGSQRLVDFILPIALASEVVAVSDIASPLPLSTSDVNDIAVGQTIRDLPLDGRSWTDLATLQPGVGAIITQRSFETGGDRGTRGFGAQITISGGRPQQNNYRLDGISLNDYANGAPGSVLGGNLGADAVQEFSVVTSNSPAEYGKTSGGVVNAITRAGTNNLHGEVYEFLRNSALDARNYFDLGGPPPFKRNQFGGLIGGPIVKNRTFFFLNYEGLRQSEGVTSRATVPSNDARTGLLHNANGTVTNVNIDPAAKKYLAFWPAPNAGLAANNNTGFFAFTSKHIVGEDFGIARIDHQISSRDSLAGSYMYDRTPYTYPDGLDNTLYESLTARQIVSLEENHVFGPRFTNTFRLGLNREAVQNNGILSAINPAAADPSLGAVPGAYATQVNVSGLTPFTGGIGASRSSYHWTSYQLYDDAFFTQGRHSFKYGVSVERLQLNIFAPSNPNGQFSFGSLAAFLTNKPSKFNAVLPTGASPRDLHETVAGGYAQDDWRLFENFTVNAGLRYEMSTVLTETHGKLAALRTLTDATPHLGDPFFTNPTLTNFEPRIGFAWDPFRKGRSVLRGAFGLYDVLPLPYEFILPTTSSLPFTALGTVSGSKLPAGSFYTGAAPLLGPTSLRVSYVQPDPKRNYVMQWNLNVQQELTSDLSVMLGYVGSRGVHQPYYSNQFDIVLPTQTPAGYLWPAKGAVINPNFGSIRGLMWVGTSSYNALQVGVSKRMSHGLQAQASYTWSRSLDQTSSSLAPDAFGNSISTLPYFDIKRSYGLSDFNVSRILVLNMIYQVPQLHSSLSAIQWLTGGWQLGGIYKASDGVPFTPTWGSDGDPLGSNGVADYPNRLGGAGCNSLVNPGKPLNYVKTQCFAVPQPVNLLGNAGRNILIGPGQSNLDASVFKTIHIPGAPDRYDIQFRTEFFNVLNHPNFALPASNDIFDASGNPSGNAGVIAATTTSAREIQFGAKVRW